MPSNFTEHYSLSQWERTDKVQMEDFNDDNAKIDGALAGKAEQSALNALSRTVSGHTAALSKLGNCQIQVLTYTGKGTGRPSITFPQMPVFAIDVAPNGDYVPLWPDIRNSRYSCNDEPVGLIWDGCTLELTAATPQFQMNAKGSGYRVIAFYAQDAE